MQQQLDNLLYVWHQRTLYIGPSYHPRQRHYDAAILLIGLEQPFIISGNGNPQVTTQMALLPPSTPFYINTNDKKVAVMYLDYFTCDYKILAGKTQKNQQSLHYEFDQDIENQCAELVSKLEAEKLSIDRANQLITLLGLKHHTIANFCAVPEPRLRQLIHKYLTGELHRNCKVHEAAATIGLSVARLGQLFKQQFGMTFKSFRNRHLMHCYMLSIAHDKSFSQAAAEAGFTDQSHFCKHFKRKTGLQSSLYIQQRQRQTCFVDPEIAQYYKDYYEFGGRDV